MSDKLFSGILLTLVFVVAFGALMKCENDCEARRCRPGAKAQLVRGLGGIVGYTCACIEEP